MAFTNDYLKKEEKAKFEEYSILYPQESDQAKQKVGVSNGRISCTLDREREMYLFQAENSEDRREYDEYIEYFTFVIVDGDKVSVMYINLVQESGITQEDKDYDILWKLKGWDMSRANDYTKEMLIEFVKEALCAYGCWGSIENIKFKVEFEF